MRRRSIVYAVMERPGGPPLQVGSPCSDIGLWGALWDIAAWDANGNAKRGRVALRDTRNSLVHATGEILTAVVGLDDVVAVTTDDAVLVTSREAAGNVKGLVEGLRRRGEPEEDAHRLTYRTWGSYQRIDIGGRFQVKRITVKPGGRLSLQKHYHRAEHWIVVRGTAEVTVEGVVKLVHDNEAAYLPIGRVHRLVNPGKIPLELIDVQVGSYTGEDDIIRIEDVHGRERRWSALGIPARWIRRRHERERPAGGSIVSDRTQEDVAKWFAFLRAATRLFRLKALVASLCATGVDHSREYTLKKSYALRNAILSDSTMQFLPNSTWTIIKLGQIHILKGQWLHPGSNDSSVR